MKSIRTTLLTVLSLLLLGGSAFATVSWMKTFNNLYKPESGSALKKSKCLICHTKPSGKEGENAYGKALVGKEPEIRSLRSIERLDSDNDGVSNIAEIKADSLPGDAKSK